MNNFDFTAHKHLSNSPKNNVQQAIDSAIGKSHMGIYKVCVTDKGEVLVLPEFSFKMRDDIAELVYDTEKGYCISSDKGEKKWSC